MEQLTQQLWSDQNRHDGDRFRLFSAVFESVGDAKSLYPGSFVDVSASAVFSRVTYVDVDARAKRFFADRIGVFDIVESMSGDRTADYEFVHADYRDDLPLKRESFDLLVSLYAGFVSEHCTRYLKLGGTLLVGPSHGDAALASIDARYELSGVVNSRSGSYSVSQDDLGSYLQPKKPITLTPDFLHARGRGIAYTRSPFAYLFQRRS